MSFVGSPSMPEGPQQHREPELEAALRGARLALNTLPEGQSKAATGVANALARLARAVENDDRVFPRMRPVR